MAKKAASVRFEVDVVSESDGSAMSAIPVPVDVKDVFGSGRPPVVVRVEKAARSGARGSGAGGGYEYRSTVCRMGGDWWVPLRKSNREAAGVELGDRVRVTLTADDKPRTVTPPKDLAAALKKAGVMEAWKAMSFTHQREYVEAIEEAKKPETRERRVAGCVEKMHERAAKAAAKTKAKPTGKTIAKSAVQMKSTHR